MNQQTDEQYVLNAKVLQNVLNYLGTRPYVEVAQLVSTLLSSKKLGANNAETQGQKEAQEEGPRA